MTELVDNDSSESSSGAAGTGESEAETEGAEQSLGTTAARGYLWANLGVFTRYFSALLLAAVLARTLTTSEYAVMITVMLLTFYFDSALDLGMGAALIYEQEEGITKRVQVAFTANVMLSVVLAILAFFIAPVVTSFFNLEGYEAIFRCLPILILMSGMTTVPWALFERELEFRKRAIVEVTRDFGRFVITIALAAAGFGAWAVMIGLFFTYAIWLVGTWYFIRFRPRPAWDTPTVKELFAYAWRMAGNRLLGMLALNGDYFIAANRQPSQYPMYYQAFRLPEFVMGGQLNAMSAVLFPMYSRIRSDGPEALRQAMYKALRLVALFSLPVGAGLALIARDSIHVMYGTDAPVAVTTMQLLSLAGCIVGLGYATGDLLFAIGKPGVMMRFNLVMVPLMLLSMWLVAPNGVQWIAAVHLCVAIVFVALRQVVVNRMVGASFLPTVQSLVPGLVCTAFVVAFALPVRLVTSVGILSMFAIVAAGAVGAVLSAIVHPPIRTEVQDLITRVRG